MPSQEARERVVDMIGKPDDLAFSAICKKVIAAWRFAIVGADETYVLCHGIRLALDDHPSCSCSQIGNRIWRAYLVARITVTFFPSLKVTDTTHKL